MATMIEMLGAQAVQNNSKTGLEGVSESFQGGMKTAVGLAQAKQSMVQQEENLKEMKAEAAQKKLMAVANRTKALMFAPDAQAGAIENNLKSFGEQSNIPIDIEALRAIRKDPQTRIAAQKALNDLTLGKVPQDPDQILGLFSSSPELFAYVNSRMSENAASQQAADFKTKELTSKEGIADAKVQAARDAAQARIDAADFRAEQKAKNKPTMFDETRDKKFADTTNEFIDAGGFAGVDKQLDTLDEQLKQLDVGKGSGGVSGLLPGFAKDIVDPEAAALQQNVLSVVQSSMKATLGAQFTQMEGVGILERAFNPRQAPQENAKRIRRIAKEIREIAKAKQAAFEYASENGTLKGYKGKTSFSIDGVGYSLKQSDVTSAPASAPAEAPTATAPKATPNLAAAKRLSALPDKVKARAALEKQLGRALMAEEAALFGGQ